MTFVEGGNDTMLERVMHDPDVMRAAAEEAEEEAKQAGESMRNARAARVQKALRAVKEKRLAKTARKACRRNEMIVGAIDGVLRHARAETRANASGIHSDDNDHHHDNAVVYARFENMLRQDFVQNAMRAVAGDVSSSSSSSCEDDDEEEEEDEDEGESAMRNVATAATALKLEAIRNEKAGGERAVDLRAAAERLNAAQAQRQIGNAHFSDKNYAQSTVAYRAAVAGVEPLCASGLPEARELLPVLVSNLAASLLKEDEFTECVRVCDMALGITVSTPSTPSAMVALTKCRYRRAVAAMHLEDFDAATADFAAVLEAEPWNHEVNTRMRQLARRRRLATERDTRLAAAALGLNITGQR